MSGDITRGRAEYPQFLRYGEGRCAERGNRDDFTEANVRARTARAARERAKAVCRACPFRAPCLAWAVETKQEGVYGATTTEERREYGDQLRTRTGAALAGAH